MFRAVIEVLGGYGGATGSPQTLVGLSAVGVVQGTTGSVTIDHRGALVAQPATGELLYAGDLIETGFDGQVDIVFVDGTTFQLYPNSRLVVDAFDYGTQSSSNTARFRVAKGKFGFLAGKVAAAGQLLIDTPLNVIRSVAPAAGVGSLAFAFMLCLIREGEASSEDIIIIDEGQLDLKDFEHGAYEIITKEDNPRVIVVDDPTKMLVFHLRGSSVSVEYVSITPTQLVQLQSAYQSAYTIFVRAGDFIRQFDAQSLSGTKFTSIFPSSLSEFVLHQLSTAPGNQGIAATTTTASTSGPGAAGFDASFVTIPATVSVLPISNDQHTPIFFGPGPTAAIGSVVVPFTDRQSLVSVHIVGLPPGESITDGNGNVYSGSDIVILAANFLTGLTLSGNPPSAGTLLISATVLGPAGPLESTPVVLELTLDLQSSVRWINSSGGDWHNPANWSTGAVPIPFQDIIIDAPGIYTITSAQNVTIDSVLVPAGVTLQITGGTFAMTTANARPLSNAGTILVGPGATLSIGENSFPGLATNTGILRANGGTINLVNLTVDNTGTIQVDLNSVLSLQTLFIDGGTVTNAGLLVAVGGTGSAITNVASFTNNGTLLVTGAGTTLALLGETLTNGGTVQVNAGASLNLTNVIVNGGLFAGSGTIAITGDGSTSTLSGVTIAGGTSVTVTANTTLILLGPITGGGQILVAGPSTINATGIVSVPIGASGLANDALLTLVGTSDLAVINLIGDLDASGLTGTLTVTTGNATDDTISIVTGSGVTTITANGAGDTVTIDAALLLEASTLTLVGSAAFVVTGLVGDLDASGLTGTLDVTTADNIVDNTIAITTGSGATTITANGAADTVTVDAALLSEASTLTLIGSAAFVVTGLVGDLNAGGVTGTLNVTTGDATNNAIIITTGSAATSITATGLFDLVVVNAAALAQNTLLTLVSGANSFISVLGLTGDLDASGTAGLLTVATGDAGDNGITITTGSGATSITLGAATVATDTVTVHAGLLANNASLTLSAAINFVVDGLAGNLNASGLTGTLNVTTADNVVDNTIAITTGSAATSITGTGGAIADTVAVNATALLDNTTLTLSGPTNFTVTGLRGDLAATGVSGTLNVTTANVAGLSIATGTGPNIINAMALTASQVLTLTGANAATVTLNGGDLSAALYTGDITVTGGAGANTITTGSGTDIITGAGGPDIINAGSGNDTINLADGDFVALESIDGGDGTDDRRLQHRHHRKC